TTIELDEELAEAARYNFADLPNVEVVNADSTDWLADYPGEQFDLVFIDPARRGEGNTRLFNISDCAPDVLSLLPLLRSKARKVLVKLSPMLDVRQTLRDLPDTAQLHIVEERGECRELLAILDFTQTVAEPQVIVHYEGVEVRLSLAEETAGPQETGIPQPKPGIWLCEPGPAAMKAGMFNQLAKRFGATQLHRNTHLFLSETKPDSFPGKCRIIEAVHPLSSSTLKAVGKSIGKADVAIRNLPNFTPELLAKRIGVKPGGDRRIVGCTVADGSKALIVVRKDCS
ncbi:MAG: hypothetical protein K2O33_08390, partial [Muribaculaceae bacterium]|nr:hypothetical protein [Muribaculaceae bacterium]